MATVYKTPGVFVEEIPKLPPSVAQVETAIPAFVGFTERADDISPDDLLTRPKRIGSMVEFEQYFGGGPSLVVTEVNIDDANNWQGLALDDDVVLSHGESLIKQNGNNDDDHQYLLPPVDQNQSFHRWSMSSTSTILAMLLLSLGLMVLFRWQCRQRRKRDHHQYEPIGGPSDVEEVP